MKNKAISSIKTYHLLKERGIIRTQLEYAIIRLSNFKEFTYHDIMMMCKFGQSSASRVLNQLKKEGYAEIKTIERRGESTVQVLKWKEKGHYKYKAINTKFNTKNKLTWKK